MRAGACAHATSSPLMELGFIHCGNSEATFYRAASGNDPVSIALQQGEVFCLELAKSWLTWTSDQAKSHPIHLKRIAEPRPAGILHSQACTKWPGWGRGGGYFSEFLEGLCRPVLPILTLFQTITCDFPHPFTDLASGVIKLRISAEVKNRIGKIYSKIQLEWYILDASLSILFIWSWKDKYVYKLSRFPWKPYPI